MSRGNVFQIQRYCINDGPGIRTCVFLKGCPLDCIWCHNPEAKRRDPQVLCRLAKCHGCGDCARICLHNCHKFEEGKHVLDFSDCVLCGNCISACQAGALEIVGYECTAEEVVEAVRKDKIFYDTSGGGVTISGGEPLMQVDFLIDLFTLAKEKGIHTCIDSSGIAFNPDSAALIQKLDKLMTLTDLVMLDIKHIDPEKHRELTLQPNENILKFAAYLNEKHVDMWIRHVVVPGITDDEKYLFDLGYFIGQFENLKALDVLPYHTMGEKKYESLGMEYKLKGVPAMDKDKLLDKKKAIIDGIKKRRS